MTFEGKHDIINISNEREVLKMECLYERACPYFYEGKCLMEKVYEPCVMGLETLDDDSYDYDDIYNNNWLEDDSYDYDD